LYYSSHGLHMFKLYHSAGLETLFDWFTTVTISLNSTKNDYSHIERIVDLEFSASWTICEADHWLCNVCFICVQFIWSIKHWVRHTYTWIAVIIYTVMYGDHIKNIW